VAGHIRFDWQSSKAYEQALSSHSYGFGLTNGDENAPWYPYYVYRMIARNIAVGDSIVSSANSANVKCLAWMNDIYLHIVLINISPSTVTLNLSGITGLYKYEKVDNTYSFLTPQLQLGTMDVSGPLTLAGYTVMYLTTKGVWYSAPPAADGKPLWVSYAKFTAEDELVGVWSTPVQLEGDSIHIEYSIDGSTNWHSAFTTGDLWAHVRSGLLDDWGEAFKIAAENGKDGADGNFTDLIFIRASSQPATPSGNGTPSGWSDGPPAPDGNPLWMSKGKKAFDGTLIGDWSEPVKLEGLSIHTQYSSTGDIAPDAVFGQTTIPETGDYMHSDHVWAVRFQAPAHGIISKLSVYCGVQAGAPVGKCAVFSDNNGHPNALLAAGNQFTAPSSLGWIDSTGFALEVTQGEYYWLALFKGVDGGADYLSVYTTLRIGETSYLSADATSPYAGGFVSPYHEDGDEGTGKTFGIYATYTPDSEWHDVFDADTDLYMRVKTGDGDWSNAMRVVGEAGTSFLIEYSIDGLTGWHSTLAEGDFFAHSKLSTDSGWGVAYRIVAQLIAYFTPSTITRYDNAAVQTGGVNMWQKLKATVINVDVPGSIRVYAEVSTDINCQANFYIALNGADMTGANFVDYDSDIIISVDLTGLKTGDEIAVYGSSPGMTFAAAHLILAYDPAGPLSNTEVM
jgi:hypothetical protein